jgi:hypothetical protein
LDVRPALNLYFIQLDPHSLPRRKVAGIDILPVQKAPVIIDNLMDAEVRLQMGRKLSPNDSQGWHEDLFFSHEDWIGNDPFSVNPMFTEFAGKNLSIPAWSIRIVILYVNNFVALKYCP